MGKNLFFTSLIFLVTACGATDGANYAGKLEPYALPDVYTKLVDNYGNGYEELYGTRNFRAILKGVAYRGGANNAYNRNGKRNNSNPLPNEGLDNLCREGFKHSVYLYPTNYATAPKVTNCTDKTSASNTLNYLNETPYSDTDVRAMLELVHASIMDSSRGPIYFHCWNGWHASGLISAMILKQFCGYNDDEAVAYWDKNTDGNNKGSGYDGIRQRIRKFVPHVDLQISKSQRAEICY